MKHLFLYTAILCSTIALQAHRLKNIRVYPYASQLIEKAPLRKQANNFSETDIIKNIIRPGDIIIEAGTHAGAWCNNVLQNHKHVTLHAFEPGLKTFESCKKSLRANYPFVVSALRSSKSEVGCIESYEQYKNDIGSIHLHQAALSARDGKRLFYDYFFQGSAQSSFYRHLKLEDQGITFMLILTPTMSLDTFAQTQYLTTIDFLKIDTHGSEYEILQGAKNLLQQGKITCIQLSYGPGYRDAKITLQQIVRLLSAHDYVLFKIIPQGLAYIEHWIDSLEDYTASQFLAIKFSETQAITLS